MGLLQTLCLVKMDVVDGAKPSGAAGRPDQIKPNTSDPAGGPKASVAAAQNSHNHQKPAEDNSSTIETEMKELAPLLSENTDVTGSRNIEGGILRQRAM